MKTSSKPSKTDERKPLSRKPFFNPVKSAKQSVAASCVQTKLIVGAENSRHEQEADNVATSVVKSQNQKSSGTKQMLGSISSADNTQIQGKGIDESDSNLDKQIQETKGGGQSLDKNTRSEMETGFGVDFKGIKIHTGSKAVQMNQSLGAEAFAQGNDIYFNQGKYNPSSKGGKHLLAHELTHTVQQKKSSQNNQVSLKRDPNAQDKLQLTKFQVYKVMLEAKRKETMLGIQERIDSQMPGMETNLAKKDLPAGDRAMLEKYKKDRLATWEKWIADIDAAIDFIDYEEKTYLYTLNHSASKYDKIVWHSSGMITGWIRESESYAIKEIESSGAYKMGVRQGTYFAKLRKGGASFENAVAKTIGLGILDLTGVSGLVEGISGRDIATGRELDTAERILKGVVGLVSIVAIGKIGISRINAWTKNIGPGNLRVMQIAPVGGFTGVMLASEAGAVLALTWAEIVTLVGAGVLNSSIMHMAASTPTGPAPQSVAGLTGGTRKAPRGGGGKPADQAYAQKVNKANGSNPPEKSVYVKGVEFDGYNPKSSKLLDAKRSKGKGSWYDVSGSSSFTLNVKIPEILKQARRQLAALPGSGAKGIEWHISDGGVATQIRNLFSKNGISIIVKHVP